ELVPAHGLHGQGGRADHSFFIAWPPNSLRIADSSLSENESASRERRRSISEAVMIGAGTSRSMASATVQRPSPESTTYAAMSFISGSRCSALAVRSSNHERTTEP